MSERNCDQVGDGTHHLCIHCGGPTEAPAYAALCDACFETLRAVTEAEEIVSANTRRDRLSKGELDKLERALLTSLSQSIDGRAQAIFWALTNLRSIRDLAEGRLVPGPGAVQLSGVEDYFRECVEEGYRLLGIAPA